MEFLENPPQKPCSLSNSKEKRRDRRFRNRSKQKIGKKKKNMLSPSQPSRDEKSCQANSRYPHPLVAKATAAAARLALQLRPSGQPRLRLEHLHCLACSSSSSTPKRRNPNTWMQPNTRPPSHLQNWRPNFSFTSSIRQLRRMSHCALCKKMNRAR